MFSLTLLPWTSPAFNCTVDDFKWRMGSFWNQTNISHHNKQVTMITSSQNNWEGIWILRQTHFSGFRAPSCHPLVLAGKLGTSEHNRACKHGQACQESWEIPSTELDNRKAAVFWLSSLTSMQKTYKKSSSEELAAQEPAEHLKAQRRKHTLLWAASDIPVSFTTLEFIKDT